MSEPSLRLYGLIEMPVEEPQDLHPVHAQIRSSGWQQWTARNCRQRPTHLAQRRE